jgi:hypothetical protein
LSYVSSLQQNRGRYRENRTTTLTVTLGSFLLIYPAAYAAQQQCSVRTLQGQHIFTGQGANLHFGSFDFDGAGTFLGKQTSARYGAAAIREKLSGSYTLSGDCTGTLTFEEQSGTEHWDIFMTYDGRKGHMIRTDPGVTAFRSFEQ